MVLPSPMRTVAACSLLAAVLLLCSPSSVQAQEDLLPAGAFVEEAIAIDINGSMLDFVVQEVIDAIPATLVVGSIPPEEVISLLLCSQDFWVENLTIHTEVHLATVQTLDTSMALVLDLDLWVNVPENPAWIVLDGCIDDACALWMEPANVQLRLPMAFVLATDDEGLPYVDFNLGTLQQDITDAIQPNLRLQSCGLTSLNAWFNEHLGMNLFTFMIGEVVTELETTIADQLVEVEAQLQDALGALSMAGEAEVLGVPLSYRIGPTTVGHSPQGLRMVLGGSVWAERAPCVGDLDLGGSTLTDGFLPSHYDSGQHLRTLLGDELLNQAGYSLWRSGALCFEAGEIGDTPLTTELLSLLVGEAIEPSFEALFPEGPSELLIRSVPWNAPRIRFDGPHQITIDIEDLDIEFYGVLYERWSRLAAVSVDLRVGIDLSLAADGALRFDVTMGDESVTAFGIYSEPSPDLTPILVDNFSGILNVALGALIGDIGEGFSLGLPTVAGIGLSELYVEPDGSLLDFTSASFGLGPSEGGESSGCEGEESCATEGGGCDELGSGCGEESGLGCEGTEGGCDAQALLEGAGCSGEASEVPPEQGCSGRLLEVACGTAGRPRKPSTLGVLVVTMALLSRRRRRWTHEAVVESSLRA
ncbi:MAG: hypothetical protein VX498_12285 [Myxococcota bacterium]|nr:hypothetical protein [Myxococcota bacterium]